MKQLKSLLNRLEWAEIFALLVIGGSALQVLPLIVHAQTPPPSTSKQLSKEQGFRFEALSTEEKLAQTEYELAVAKAQIAAQNAKARQQAALTEICNEHKIPVADCRIYDSTDNQSGERKWYITKIDRTPPPSSTPPPAPAKK